MTNMYLSINWRDRIPLAEGEGNCRQDFHKYRGIKM
jgi:hypothetical protein